MVYFDNARAFSRPAYYPYASLRVSDYIVGRKSQPQDFLSQSLTAASRRGKNPSRILLAPELARSKLAARP